MTDNANRHNQNLEASRQNWDYYGMARQVRKVPIIYKDLVREIDLPGWYSEDGTDSIHSGEDLEIWDKTLQEMKAEWNTK